MFTLFTASFFSSFLTFLDAFTGLDLVAMVLSPILEGAHRLTPPLQPE